MNNISLIGRLATDVDLQSVTDGSQVATFILAVDCNAEEADFAYSPTRLHPRQQDSGAGRGAAALGNRSARSPRLAELGSYRRGRTIRLLFGFATLRWGKLI